MAEFAVRPSRSFDVLRTTPSGAVDGDHEAEIVAAAQHDIAHFAPLYTHYRPAIYGYCYRRLGHVEAAADLTQAIFLRAIRALPGYHPKPGATFRAWLFTIAHNMLIDERRKLRPSAPPPAWLRDHAPLPEEIAIAHDRQAHVFRAVAMLPERSRRIVELRLAGLTGADIAHALGMTLSAVKSDQFRAYGTLRTLLDDPE
jgi:RNA polymerase sigma-70 factor (ECF subfamily)